jgi:hypothetical protein
MLNGFKAFHHRGNPEPALTVRGDSHSRQVQPSHGDQHPSHAWSRHILEVRRLQKRDECFRGLVELEAELLHEVERDA